MKDIVITISVTNPSPTLQGQLHEFYRQLMDQGIAATMSVVPLEPEPVP